MATPKGATDARQAASGYALRSFAARAQSTQESGQPTCYQTGQFYLLLTQSLGQSNPL